MGPLQGSPRLGFLMGLGLERLSQLQYFKSRSGQLTANNSPQLTANDIVRAHITL